MGDESLAGAGTHCIMTLPSRAKPTGMPVIGVHLDLKGVAFRPTYDLQLLDDLRSQKVNMVLVEYEDVFPFEGLDIAADRSTVWSRRRIARFQEEARRRGIEVVPLQQCLGHLEYLFCWKKYRRFAEDQQYPSTLKLDARKGKELIFELLRQMIEAHPQSRYVHVGMDEAHGLKKAAKRLGRDVLDLFLEHLDELLKIVARFGKTPLVWSDMLEDHFRPDAFAPFKDKVIMMTWDYNKVAGRAKVGRLAGLRVSRSWLEEPQNPAAPPISASSTFIEDYSNELQSVVRPYLHGREFTPLFQIDLWTRLGFRVIAASAVRASAHGAILPRYNDLISNVQGWSEAIHRTGQLGQVATSWARGTTWCPPNFSIDLAWPIINAMSESMGAKPEPFWSGIPPRAVGTIVATLGRCREDWRLEGRIAAEMESLSPKVRKHRYEWDSLALAARLLELQRRMDYALLEVDFFEANNRPVATEWRRRLSEQARVLKDMDALRRRLRTHFGKRYHGDAFEEWLKELFDLHIRRIKEAQRISRRKLMVARKVYAAR